MFRHKKQTNTPSTPISDPGPSNLNSEEAITAPTNEPNEPQEKPCLSKIYNISKPYLFQLLELLLKKLVELAKKKLSPSKKSTTEHTENLDATLSPSADPPAGEPPAEEPPAEESPAADPPAAEPPTEESPTTN